MLQNAPREHSAILSTFIKLSSKSSLFAKVPVYGFDWTGPAREILVLIAHKRSHSLSNSYTMACGPVCGDNQRALASGVSYVQVDKHGITILYHLHQCRPCTSRDSLC